MTRLLDMIKDMVVAVARLEKKPAEAQSPTATSELEHVLPQPPPQVQFPHIPTSQPEIRVYVGMQLGEALPKQMGSGQTKTS